MGKRLISERMIQEWARHSTIMEVPPDAIITDLARDKAKQLGVTFRILASSELKPKDADRPKLKADAERKVAVGADHGGFPMKERIKALIESLNFTVVDVGTNSTDAVDYPDYAHAVAKLVADGNCKYGIMIDGAGIGSSMVANKVPGVRAALCHDVTSALNSREHNDANILTLGARMIGDVLAEHIVKIWLLTDFSGGRHQARVDKILDVEKRYTK